MKKIILIGATLLVATSAIVLANTTTNKTTVCPDRPGCICSKPNPTCPNTENCVCSE